MTPFSAVVGGGFAGFAGAVLAHVIAILAERAGAGAWLRGPYGPPFFVVALYTGVFYAAIGGAAGRRTDTAGLGFFIAFFGVLLPMFVLTRYAGWGMPRGADVPTAQWQAAVVLVYAVAIWGTIAGLGAAATRTAPHRGAAAAMLGSLAAYGVLALLLKIFSAWAQSPWNPQALIPSPVNLLDGLLSGAGLCLALSLDEKLSRRPS